MVDLSDFKRGQIVAARLAGATVTKTAELFSVARSNVLKVMAAFVKERKTSLPKAKLWKKAKSV